ncbi:hypothetical protein [Burkholderia glumae]|uniref:hypothetical protein n=1 Tax=Burkholderia glumae TaxID=337 RepID=UPI003BAD75F9
MPETAAHPFPTFDGAGTMLDTTLPFTPQFGDERAMLDAEYFEYTSSANPIGAKLISRVPYRSFAASLCDSGPTRVVPLDLSAELGCDYPATGPCLLASFVRIVAGEQVTVDPNATSQVCYVIDGAGSVAQRDSAFRFGRGIFSRCPAARRRHFAPIRPRASTTSAMRRCSPIWAPAPRNRASRRRSIRPPAPGPNSTRWRRHRARRGATA